MTEVSQSLPQFGLQPDDRPADRIRDHIHVQARDHIVPDTNEPLQVFAVLLMKVKRAILSTNISCLPALAKMDSYIQIPQVRVLNRSPRQTRSFHHPKTELQQDLSMMKTHTRLS